MKIRLYTFNKNRVTITDTGIPSISEMMQDDKSSTRVPDRIGVLNWQIPTLIINLVDYVNMLWKKGELTEKQVRNMWEKIEMKKLPILIENFKKEAGGSE